MIQTVFTPRLPVKIFFWGLFIIYFSLTSLISILQQSLFNWLYENFTIEQVANFDAWFFGSYGIWLISISVWFVILGIKTLLKETYPPENFPIPFKTKLLTGLKAKQGGALLCIIAIFIFLVGSSLIYAQSISHGSSI